MLPAASNKPSPQSQGHCLATSGAPNNTQTCVPCWMFVHRMMYWSLQCCDVYFNGSTLEYIDNLCGVINIIKLYLVNLFLFASTDGL